MPDTALIIGLPVTCRRLERQLDLLDDRPVTIGWVLAGGVGDTGDGDPILGSIDELEAIIACRNSDTTSRKRPRYDSGTSMTLPRR